MSVDEARELYGLLGSLAAAMDEDRYAGADIVRRAAAWVWERRNVPIYLWCEECNAGGHTCPGDGDDIAHGESMCSECRERFASERSAVLDEELAKVEISTEPGANPVGKLIEVNERVEKRMKRYEAQCTCSPIKQEYCHVKGCKGGSMLGEYGIKQEREIPVSQLVTGDSVYSPSTKTWHEVRRSTAGQLYFQRDGAWRPVDFAADVKFLTRRGEAGAPAGLLFDAFGGEVIEE